MTDEGVELVQRTHGVHRFVISDIDDIAQSGIIPVPQKITDTAGYIDAGKTIGGIFIVHENPDVVVV